ncbi:thiolase family protein [Blastococcus montanus]|uniref:thiolase family protein n=1 Tax=Blastococcus montanus TaxID=3144973 RepID=UPI0032086E85
MTRRAVVVDVVRSPFAKGKDTGALVGVHPVDLLAGVLAALQERTGIDPGRIDDVIAGCVLPVGEQSGNVARHAVLAAGWPEEVPATTIDRKCGSAQQALQFAAQAVVAGEQDAVVAAGVDMMSTVPMKANRLGRDELGPRLRGRYPDGMVRQGISAELIAARWGIGREECDAWSVRSHRRAAAAQEAGDLTAQIEPVTRPDGTVVDRDEGIRAESSMETLARLKPAFRDEAMAERYPEIDWVVTAGSSSQVSDGAAAALVVSEDVAERWGLRPRAAVVRGVVVGVDPVLMLHGVIPATERVLARTGLAIDDIDVAEVNEAFAPIVLAWLKETGADPERVNVHGGAIAFGHPVGASGGRLLATLIDALEGRHGRYGLLTMCESGGMANATVLERLS